MNKRNIIYLIVGVVFIASALLSVWILRRTPHTNIEIVQDGTILYTIDLQTAENQEICVDSQDGKSYNIVTITDGTVCVSEAGCPDQTCVQMGVLRSDYLPIVCLPNRLIVRYAEEDTP